MVIYYIAIRHTIYSLAYSDPSPTHQEVKLMEIISSRTNEKIKQAAGLAENASLRRSTGLFLLEGARLCADAAGSGVKIARVFATRKAIEKYPDYLSLIQKNAEECYEITPEVAAKLSETRSDQGVFCVCEMLDNSMQADKINSCGRYIALENIQDPANLGAVCRTAEALGIDGIVAGGGCDVYNPKALRAAMGSSLRMPIFKTDALSAFLKQASEAGVRCVAFVLDGDPDVFSSINGAQGIICVIGNEGAGITAQTRAVCSDSALIPMKGKAESLNAAAGAAIVMWELVR